MCPRNYSWKGLFMYCPNICHSLKTDAWPKWNYWFAILKFNFSQKYITPFMESLSFNQQLVHPCSSVVLSFKDIWKWRCIFKSPCEEHYHDFESLLHRAGFNWVKTHIPVRRSLGWLRICFRKTPSNSPVQEITKKTHEKSGAQS